MIDRIGVVIRVLLIVGLAVAIATWAGARSGLVSFPFLDKSEPTADGAETKEAQQPALPTYSRAGAAYRKRVALVIGNASYLHSPSLANPLNDAADISQVLRTLGFELITLSNGNYEQTRRAIRTFADKAREADVAVAYYSGHGMAYDGVNYLIPIDAKIESPVDIDVEGIRLEHLISAAQEASRAAALFIDASRVNSFYRTFRSAQRGLVPLALGSKVETMLVFAAESGSTSADGEGRNSPFAYAIVKNLGAEGDILRVGGRISESVRQMSSGGQSPEIHVARMGATPLCLVQCEITEVYASVGDTSAPRCTGSYEAVDKPKQARLVLVIAEAAYTGPSLRSLSATVADGEVISKALPNAGFATRVCYNLRLADLRKELDGLYRATEHAVKDWEQSTDRSGDTRPTVFFYYSGHGASSQREGANYLIPVGYDVSMDSELPDHAYKVGTIADSLMNAGAFAIVVADACRTTLRGTKGERKGFVPEVERDGAIIAFSAAPGQVALDKNDYSKALAGGILKAPGEEVRSIFVDVRVQVNQTSVGEQKPYVVDGLTGRFYFQTPK